MEDEFNSSDIEYVPPAKPFPNLGARSIQKLRDNAEADRVESKRNSKELTICSGTLATRKHFALWSNRYEAFVTDTLEKDLANSKPKGEDIERFFFAITKYLQPQGNAQTAIPYSTLEGALVVVLKAIRLHHEDFRLTHRENYRIKDVFQTLVDKGIATREPTRQRQWLSSQFVARLVLGLFQDAIVNGAYDWCSVINRSLNLALMAAVGCRAGDAAGIREQQPEEEELQDKDFEEQLTCLSYKHILITFKDPVTSTATGEMKDVKIQAKITLQFIKGKKDDPSRNHEVYLDSVNQHYADPLKLIIIQALRTGAVTGNITDLSQLVKTTLESPGRTVAWAFPERPVLCAYTPRGVLLPDTPAPVLQLQDTLNKAATVCGLTTHLRSHDIRRGAAAEISRLPTKRSLANASDLLDHTTKDIELTRWSVGPLRASTYGERLALPEDDPFALKTLDPDVLPAQKRRRRIGPNEVTAALEDDPEARLRAENYQNPRKAAVKVLRNRSAQNLVLQQSISFDDLDDYDEVEVARQLTPAEVEECDRMLKTCSGPAFVDHFARRNDHPAETRETPQATRHGGTQWVPGPCPIDASHEHVFDTRERMVMHLRLQHGLTFEEKTSYITQSQPTDVFPPPPRPRTGGVLDFRCPINGAHKQPFKTLRTLESHLRKVHKLTGEKLSRKLKPFRG